MFPFKSIKPKFSPNFVINFLKNGKFYYDLVILSDSVVLKLNTRKNMKHLKQLALIYLILLALGACSEESFIDFSNFPELTIEEGRNHQMNVGEVLNLHLIITTTTAPMRSLEIYKNGKLVQTSNLESTNALRHSFDFLALKVDANTAVTLTFVGIDANGNATAINSVILVDETPLTYTFSNASISNSNGLGLNSWDLTTNQGNQLRQQVITSTTDMRNHSTANSGWIKGWKSTSATQFVKLTTPPASIDDLSLEDITALYQSNNPLLIVTVNTGDWLIARLRNTNEYAVIYMEEVSETIDNKNELIRFTYKKTKAIAGQD